MLTMLKTRVHAADEAQGVIEYTLAAGVISIGLYLAFATGGIVTGIENAASAIVATLP